MSCYVCKYFNEREIVYPGLYFSQKEKGRVGNIWLMFDPFLLISADLIREFIESPININEYEDDCLVTRTAGAIESGLRKTDSKTGASLSMHKYANAFDLKFNSATWNPEKLRLHMEKIGCFKKGFKKIIPPINISSFLGSINQVRNDPSLKDDKKSLTNFVYSYLGEKVPKDVIPFIFINATEWLYRDEKEKKMNWFHMDVRNSVEDYILLVK